MSTYEEIYERMKNAYANRTGSKPDDASDAGLRFAVLASEVYSLLCGCDWLKRQMFADTASGESLDLHAKQRGLKRKSSTAAVGEVCFGVEEAAQKRISIPKGTVVSTEDAVPIMFATTADCAISVGSKSASVSVKAVDGGRKGNIPKGRITNIVTSVPYVETVTNVIPFSGGTDDESDDELRIRITESFRNISNGTNKAYYRDLCESIDGVGSVGVIPRNRGIGTVDVFLAGQGATASEEAVAQANRILEKAREVNVDAKAFAAKEKTVEFRIWVKADDIYSRDDVSRRCIDAAKELVSNARVGEDIQLSKLISCLMKLDGVLDVMFSSSYNNVTIDDDTKAVAGRFAVDFM